MRIETTRKLCETIAGLADLHGKSLSETVLHFYVVVVKEFEDDQILAGLEKLPGACSRFPLPADLKAVVQGTDRDSSSRVEAEAALAWSVVLRTLNRYAGAHFDDPRVGEAIRLMGGYNRLCDSEEEQTQWLRKEFMQVFALAHQRQKEGLVQDAPILGLHGNEPPRIECGTGLNRAGPLRLAGGK